MAKRFSMLEALLVGAGIGVGRFFLTVNQPLVVAVISLWVVLRFSGKDKAKDAVAYTALLYAGMLAAAVILQKLSGLRGVLFLYGTEASITVGNTLVWWELFIRPEKGIKKAVYLRTPVLFLKPAVYLPALLLLGIGSGCVVGAIKGVLTVPTTIWMAALLTGIIMRRYWQWFLGVFLFGASALVCLLVVHWGAFRFFRYSSYEFWVVYNEYLAMMAIQLVLFAIPRILLINEAKKDIIEPSFYDVIRDGRLLGRNDMRADATEGERK
jgi:hypothetical protein